MPAVGLAVETAEKNEGVMLLAVSTAAGAAGVVVVAVAGPAGPASVAASGGAAGAVSGGAAGGTAELAVVLLALPGGWASLSTSKPSLTLRNRSGPGPLLSTYHITIVIIPSGGHLVTLISVLRSAHPFSVVLINTRTSR